jgi:hypothetical protein
MSNGLSDTPNDGADFGPDTLYGATAPGQYGPPYSHTSGIQEAYNYLGRMGGGVVFLKSGTYYLKDILYLQYSNTKIVGEDMYSTVIYVMYPLNALGSGGFQNSNPIVTTNPTGSANPEYTGLENLTINMSNPSNVEESISAIVCLWGSHLTFRNIRIAGLNGANPNPGGFYCNADYVTLEHIRARESDYLYSGSSPEIISLAGGSYVTVRDVYMDGVMSFTNLPTPNSVYEDITINGGTIMFDGYNAGDWGYTVFKNLSVFNGTLTNNTILPGYAVCGNLQTGNGIYCVDCYFEGIVTAAPTHTYNSKFVGGVMQISDFRNNYVYFNGSLMTNYGFYTPIVIASYWDNGYNIARVVGNVFVNIDAHNNQNGAAFVISGFESGGQSQNILEIRDNTFLTPFNGLFGYDSPQSTTLTLIIDNNKGPFITTMGNSGGNPPIGAASGSIIRGNNFLVPSYPFSSGSSVQLQANPPVPGTVYQNVNPFEIELHIPVFSISSGLSGTVTVYKGPTSPPAQVGTMFISGETSPSSPQIVTLRVPPWWYYEINVSGVTVGQAVALGLQ